MPMHMGIPPLGIPTLEEAGCREAEAWDEMFDAMLDEHLERHLEGLEADSLAHMVQDHARRARQPPPKRARSSSWSTCSCVLPEGSTYVSVSKVCAMSSLYSGTTSFATSRFISKYL